MYFKDKYWQWIIKDEIMLITHTHTHSTFFLMNKCANTKAWSRVEKVQTCHRYAFVPLFCPKPTQQNEICASGRAGITFSTFMSRVAFTSRTRTTSHLVKLQQTLKTLLTKRVKLRAKKFWELPASSVIIINKMSRRSRDVHVERKTSLCVWSKHNALTTCTSQTWPPFLECTNEPREGCGEEWNASINLHRPLWPLGGMTTGLPHLHLWTVWCLSINVSSAQEWYQQTWADITLGLRVISADFFRWAHLESFHSLTYGRNNIHKCVLQGDYECDSRCEQQTGD